MPTLGIKMRVFAPKEVFDSSLAMRNIQHVMIQKTTRDLRREFEKTVRTWADKPNFPTQHYFGSSVLWVKVYTYSRHYCLVNAGAAPHMILPKKSRMLRFRTGYRAKSRARVVGSFAGGKFGNYISTEAVMHPGFEAREFDATIADEYQDTFVKDVQQAISDAALPRGWAKG
jgi:hypothetical protein